MSLVPKFCVQSLAPWFQPAPICVTSLLRMFWRCPSLGGDSSNQEPKTWATLVWPRAMFWAARGGKKQWWCGRGAAGQGAGKRRDGGLGNCLA